MLLSSIFMTATISSRLTFPDFADDSARLTRCNRSRVRRVTVASDTRAPQRGRDENE